MKTENIIRLLKILAKHDGHEDVFWREDKEGELHFFVNINDVFYWATSDAEKILDEDLDDLEQAYNDSREAGKYRIGIYGSLLWVCRKLKMRPQGAYFYHISEEEWPLFLAAGPPRGKDKEMFGNPYPAPDEEGWAEYKAAKDEQKKARVANG